LIDNTRSEVPEQVAFRIDFPAWRRTHTERDRRLIDTLMLGERTKEVSRLFGLSQGRISQKRRQFLEDWRRFCGDPAEVYPIHARAIAPPVATMMVAALRAAADPPTTVTEALPMEATICPVPADMRYTSCKASSLPGKGSPYPLTIVNGQRFRQGLLSVSCWGRS
jgi:hypothetical protein